MASPTSSSTRIAAWLDAAATGDISALQRLLEGGLDINISNKLGWTALHMAARKGHVDLIRWLASRGAALQPTDHGGRTPTHEAARGGQVEALKVLHALGCDMALESERCPTPLYMASGEPVRIFLESVTLGLREADKARLAAAASECKEGEAGPGGPQPPASARPGAAATAPPDPPLLGPCPSAASPQEAHQACWPCCLQSTPLG
ncbi:ankyrin repeat-containing domain protein [Haematococcus lacustris]